MHKSYSTLYAKKRPNKYINNMKIKFTFSLLPLLFFLIIVSTCQCRIINPEVSDISLVSDGVVEKLDEGPSVVKGFVVSDTCEDIYGLLPCSDTVIGNAFLIIAYGYLMSLAAKYLSDGSEGLLEILGPGIVGGLLLPGLSTLPDASIVLVSGLFGSKETAQIEVSVGMGLVAGSTVMALTVLWGSCIVAGKCDIVGSATKDSQDTKIFSLTGSGVSTDIWTCYAARIMLISVIPFIIVQIPQPFCTYDQSRIAILISLIFSIFFLISYFIYQVFRPRIQKRRLAYAKHKHVIAGILKHYTTTLGRLRNEDGSPNEEMLLKLFTQVDVNNDKSLSPGELRAMITGINFQEIDFDADDSVGKIIDEFDGDKDSNVNFQEFIRGMSNWLNKTKPSVRKNYIHSKSMELKLSSDLHTLTKEQHDLLGDLDNEEVEHFANRKWNIFKAVFMLIVGLIIAASFAHPFVDSINNFSKATTIPSFFVAFGVLPFVRSSEALEALCFASSKRNRTASLTLSQIYAAITMSHNLCLSVFLGLVYVRDLTWDFSAEVSIILIVNLIVGVSASLRTTFPLWTCLVAYALYPLMPLLVYIIEYVTGSP
ncbi:hypothetical protein LguiA_035113 [Lonicera macranthoides]